jgi:peptidyl-prolyl cis-trans isomerase B (cyclophilin B)
MDTVDAIAAVKTGNNSGHADVPVEDIVIGKASVS